VGIISLLIVALILFKIKKIREERKNPGFNNLVTIENQGVHNTIL